MKIKRIITLLLALVCVGAVLVSCGKEFAAKEWTENNEKTKRSASYKEFSDEKYYEIDVKGKITMNISVGTVSGDALCVEIYNVKTPNNPIYNLIIHKNEEGKFVADVDYAGEKKTTELTSDYNQTITIAGEKDEFVIHIKGQNHTGSFVFDW